MRQALSDIAVVEVGTGVAATWCGKVFADLGAEVVKLEPPEGDPMRADWGAFANLNTNKGSLVLGRSGDSSGELRRVLHDADLVVEAPGLGAPGRLGHRRAESCWRSARGSVSPLISGFGATGPYAGFAWSDLVVQAFTGALLADPLGPVKLPTAVGECAIGHTAAMGALAAVLRARATGAGAFVDCAATEALATNPTKMSLHLGWEYRDRELSAQMVPERQRNRSSAGCLALRRRQRGHDDDPPAARRDARGTGQRRAARLLRPARRVRAARGAGDPRRGALPVAAGSAPARRSPTPRRLRAGRSHR